MSLQGVAYSTDDERTALSLILMAMEGNEQSWRELLDLTDDPDVDISGEYGSTPDTVVNVLAALTDWAEAFARDLAEANNTDATADVRAALMRLGSV